GPEPREVRPVLAQQALEHLDDTAVQSAVQPARHRAAEPGQLQFDQPAQPGDYRRVEGWAVIGGTARVGQLVQQGDLPVDRQPPDVAGHVKGGQLIDGQVDLPPLAAGDQAPRG